jgi:DNA-directed RNA polymerase specialized sigma24 family protein
MASDGQRSSINWHDLCKRLYLFALTLTRRLPDVFDGSSASDLVSETVVAFLESEDRLGWDCRIASIETFLCVVLRRKAIDHFRRHSRIAGSLDDPDFNPPLNTSDGEQFLHDTLTLKELVRSVTEASSDCKLADLIRATSLLTNDGRVNQQLAEILSTSTRDVVNRKKRLLRMLKEGRRRDEYGRNSRGI